MKLREIKNWPDQKKKVFSMSVSIFITLLVVIFWIGFSFNNSSNEVAPTNNSPVDSIKDSFAKIYDQFNSTMNKISSTTSLINSEALSTGTVNIMSSSTKSTTTNKIK